MRKEPTELDGLKILVLEDNFLVAEQICDVLIESGCEVVGPAADLDRGWRALADVELNGALLDINLAGSFSFPIAAYLTERGVPFIFLSGYDDISVLPREYRAVPRISKPLDPAELVSAIANKFAAGR
jgi:DNA-binding NarL/FixJ family response regulator